MTPEQIAAIPAELKLLKQWVGFEIRNGRKMPVTPDGRPAKSNDPSTWSWFQDVLGADHIAFCFTAEDPFVFIDIDECKQVPGESEEAFTERKEKAEIRKTQIVATFPGYHEVSTSGKGLHIIGKGVVKSGCRRENLEIYPHARFCIFTGNGSGDPGPFDQASLDMLVKQLRPTHVGHVEFRNEPERMTDDELWEAIRNRGGEAFVIGSGDGRSLHTDDSLVDFKVMKELMRVCRNTVQSLRAFVDSDYYRSEKGEKYLETTLKNAIGELHQEFSLEDQMKPLHDQMTQMREEAQRVEHEKILASEEAPVASVPETPAPLGVDLPPIVPRPELRYTPHPGMLPTDLGELDTGAALMASLPPGLVRDMAFGYYGESIYPLAEVSTLAALFTFTLAAQRGFQVHNNKALNIYALLLAASSAGKSPLVDGIPRLVSAAHPAGLDYWSEELRSEAALAKHLVEYPQTVMLIQECTPWMKAMTDNNSQGWQQGASSAFTKLYSAGAGFYKAPRTKSSEKEELKLIRRPCFSIIGESQPGSLWKAIKAMGLTSGFLPRFMILEVDNRSIQAKQQITRDMPESVVAELRALLTAMIERNSQGEKAKITHITLEPDVRIAFEDYCECWRLKLKATDQLADNVDTSIYGKMGENVLKISGILAASEQWRREHPVVRMEHLQWAMNFVNHCSRNTVENLGAEGTDTSTAGRFATVMHWVNKIMAMSHEDRLANSGMCARFDKPFFKANHGFIPYSVLRDKCVHTAAFKGINKDNAFFEMVDQLVRDGDLRNRLNKKQMKDLSDNCVNFPCIQVK